MSDLSAEIIKDLCLKRGAFTVLAESRSHYRRDEGDIPAIGKALAENTDVIRKFYDDFSTGDRVALFNHAVVNGISLYNTEYWKKYIDDFISDNSEICSSIVYGREAGEEAILFLKQKHDSDVCSVFNKVIARYELVKSSWVSNPAMDLFNLFLERDSASFKDAVFDSFFAKKSSAPYPVRGSIYNVYAKNGFLTKKTARKVRSDASGDASCRGLRGLVDAEDGLYSSEDMDEILLQFTDSRYEEVVLYLAENLPTHLLPSIMGTDFYYPKRVLERRLNESLESE